MITFDKTRIEYGEDYITQKTDGLQIWYSTPSKGKITSYLIPCTKVEEETTDSEGNVVSTTRWETSGAISPATKHFDDTEFEDNILLKLHDIYIAELQEFNPNIVFTNTLLK